MGNLGYDQSAKANVSVKSLHGLMTFLQKYEKKIATWPANGEEPNDFNANLDMIYTELWQVPACAPLDPTKLVWTYEIEDHLVIKSMVSGENIKLILRGDESCINLSKEDVIAMAKQLELTDADLVE